MHACVLRVWWVFVWQALGGRKSDERTGGRRRQTPSFSRSLARSFGRNKTPAPFSHLARHAERLAQLRLARPELPVQLGEAARLEPAAQERVERRAAARDFQDAALPRLERRAARLPAAHGGELTGGWLVGVFCNRVVRRGLVVERLWWVVLVGEFAVVGFSVCGGREKHAKRDCAKQRSRREKNKRRSLSPRALTLRASAWIFSVLASDSPFTSASFLRVAMSTDWTVW